MADIPVYESTAETVVVVTANGQTTFAFDFLILHPEQLRVVLRPNSGDPEIELSYPTSFTVDGVGNENGGTITTIGVVTAVGDEFYIWRDTPIERLNDWQAEGDYKAALVNREQDTMFMIMQELDRGIKKGDAATDKLGTEVVLLPDGHPGPQKLPVPSPGRVIGYGSDGSFQALINSAAEAELIAGEVAEYRNESVSAKEDAETAAYEAQQERLAAASSASSAAMDADRSEVARDAAFTNANVYEDVAAGLSATTNGQQFQVQSGDELIRYENNAGAAVELARFPGAAIVQKRADETYSVSLGVAQDRDLYWDVQAVFVQGGFGAGGVETTVANRLRSKSAIPLKAGDAIIADPTGPWDAGFCLFDAAGNFLFLSSYPSERGVPLIVPQDGYAHIILRKTGNVPVVPADIVDNRPGVRVVISPWNNKPLNTSLGMQSLPRSALLSEPGVVTNLPIIIGGFLYGSMAPNTDRTRASTGFLHLGKGSVISTDAGYEFAEYVYDLNRQYVRHHDTWRTTPLTLAEDTVVRIYLRKSDNSSLVGLDRAPWLSIDWVQPAIVRRSSDVAPATITPEHLTFPIPAILSEPGSFHIVWNIGESHAAGRGEVKSPITIPAGAAYKYVRSTETLEQMVDPTGNDATAISGGGKGSWGPALADTVWRSTNGTTGLIFINSGLSGARIGTSWSADGDAWLQAVVDWGKTLSQIVAMRLPVSGVSVLMSLGTNDASDGTEKATFKSGVLDLYARLKMLIGAGDGLPLNIIETGPFADGTKAANVAAIQQAQQELAQENDGITIATDAPRYGAAKGQYIDNTHYNQDLNDIIGRACGGVTISRGAGVYPSGLA